MNCPVCATENRIAPLHGPTCPHHELTGDKWWPSWWIPSFHDVDGERRRCEWIEQKLRDNPAP